MSCKNFYFYLFLGFKITWDLGKSIMKKLFHSSILVTLFLSGCSIYHAPWDENPYAKAPVSKEARVYQQKEQFVNKEFVNAPVLKNENKVIQNKKVETKKATVLKEKVITVKKPVKNEVPNVSKNVVTDSPVKKEVLIIPIE